MTDRPDNTASPHSLIGVELDPGSFGRARPDIEHERQVAIFDLLHSNSFHLVAGPAGPYKLRLAMAAERLNFEISDSAGAPLLSVPLGLGAFRRLVKDYSLICESYYDAIKSAPPSRIEAIDMGRRAMHNEGSTLLLERLKGRITVDEATARRLFTLLCALHWKA
jgi:uncharacterized protein (UPF0262 family)